MQHIHATITTNTQIADGYFDMKFSLPEGAIEPKAGQFLTIRVQPGNTPLLRRPFAFSSYNSNTREAGIIYQKRGSATEILTAKTRGDDLDILSPLGNFFPEPGAMSRDSGDTTPRPVLIAGGIGMGPMFFFADRLKSEGYNPLLLVGARNSELIPDMDSYSSADTIISTDDGSGTNSFHGNVIQALDSLNLEGSLELYACGPHVMMQAANSWAERHNMPIWVSMEQTMGCAVGACMGCVVAVKDDNSYARVCAEGPIFSGGYIEWN